MRILITGSKGFIGKRLVEILSIDSEHDIIHFNRRDGQDILDKECFEKLGRNQIDKIVHLAGNTFVPQSWETPPEFIRDNVQGTTNVLELAREIKAEVVFLSTYVYAANLETPITEGSKVSPLNPYALSKYLAEQVGEFYSRNFGLSITNLRLFNVYGPSQKDYFLIPKIFKQALGSNERIEVMTFEPKRDYVYIDDVVDAIISALYSAEKKYRSFNIASGESYSVKEVVTMIQKVLGTSKSMFAKAKPRINEVMDTRCNISSAAEGLNWAPKYSFEQGLKEIAKELA